MKQQIDYVCYLNSSGYSQAAQDAIFALEKNDNFDVRITCIHNHPIKEAFSGTTYGKFMKLIRKPLHVDAIRVFHCIPDVQRRYQNLRNNISYATFETFNPPSHWDKILERSDAVICPSMFNYEIFSHRKINKPIYYIPHVLDMDLWNYNVKPYKKYEDFVFLFVGQWRRRKGWESLIEAWLTEFKKTDGVRLIIKSDKKSIIEKDIDVIKKNLNISNSAPIEIESKTFTREELPSFYKCANAFILPTMGEGFGIPPMQCMALKIPVIVTNFSGCKDYANEETASLINVSDFVHFNYMDNIPQFRNCKWPVIKVDLVKNSMRQILNNYKEALKKSDNAYNLIKNNFNFNVFNEKFNNLVEEVYSNNIR